MLWIRLQCIPGFMLQHFNSSGVLRYHPLRESLPCVGNYICRCVHSNLLGNSDDWCIWLSLCFDSLQFKLQKNAVEKDVCKQTQPPAPACKMFDVNRWCLSTPFNIEVDGLVIMIDPSSPFRARKAGETYLGERRHFDISTFRQIVSRVGTIQVLFTRKPHRLPATRGTNHGAPSWSGSWGN